MDFWWPSDTITVPPLGPNESMEGRHRVGLGEFSAGTYPACEQHGAMLRMTPGQPAIYRCDALLALPPNGIGNGGSRTTSTLPCGHRSRAESV